MRKQYHFWPGDDGGLDAWDVDRLIALTKDLPAEPVALDDIYEIDSAYWSQGYGALTVRESSMSGSSAMSTSPNPIILGPDGRVMDGMHRVARAMLDGSPHVTAVRLEALPEPDFRACRPEELPY